MIGEYDDELVFSLHKTLRVFHILAFHILNCSVCGDRTGMQAAIQFIQCCFVEENVSSDDMHALFARLDLCLIEENATETAYRTPLSISKGYTTFVPDIDTDYNKVFKRADEAMYRDKAEYYKTHDRRRG